MTKPADLIAYLFEGHSTLLSSDLSHWMGASSRFTTFVETYRDKIRKKIRLTPDRESLLDLRGELEVPFALLNDRHFGVTYEPYASTRQRGPDFGVTYRVNFTFNVEVARIRSEIGEPFGLDITRKVERIVRILLDKLGQMLPGMPNLLVIHIAGEYAKAIDLEQLMQAVKILVEKKDPGFAVLSRYPSPAAFYKDFLRLSAILLWASPPQIWVNKQAHLGIPEKVLRSMQALAEQTSNASP